MGKSYGEEVTRTMAADFLKERPVTIRCCQNKVTPEQLKKELEQEGVTVQEHPYLPYAFSSADMIILKAWTASGKAGLLCRM